MENFRPTLHLPFPRWRKDPWPTPSGMQELRVAPPAPDAEHAARQEWDNEGGAVKPPMVAGPKLPL
jgi:hypothetical protein